MLTGEIVLWYCRQKSRGKLRLFHVGRTETSLKRIVTDSNNCPQKHVGASCPIVQIGEGWFSILEVSFFLLVCSQKAVFSPPPLWASAPFKHLTPEDFSSFKAILENIVTGFISLCPNLLSAPPFSLWMLSNVFCQIF